MEQLDQTNLDSLLFIETWLSDKDYVFRLDNYRYHGLNRTYARGGGLAVYVRNDLNSEIISDFSLNNQNIECLTIGPKTVIL